MASASRTSALKTALKVVGVNLAVMVALLAAAELAIHYLMTSPDRIPSGGLLDAMRTLYWRQRDRDLIQFSRACAQHDPQLGYVLRPGSCTFSGPEFSNTFRINSLGLRDDERSLDAPEVIVLGDSHGMGWGVEQDQTFAQLIEQRRGSPVLNAAVSSYGTAREFVNLQRLNTSRLRTLVVQYDDNDLGENRSFHRNGNRLTTMSAASFDEVANAQEKWSDYYFGRELRFIARGVLQAVMTQAERPGVAAQGASGADATPALDEAELFLNVLERSGAVRDGLQIVTIDISNYGRSGSRFSDLMERRLRDRKPPFRIVVLDAGTLLRAEHYYRLDGHLNAAGHRAVADAVLRAMSGNPGS